MSSLEKIKCEVFEQSDQASREVAGRIATLIRQKAKAGEHCVLGLATGSTPLGVYRELIRLHQEEQLSFANVITFNLDEYYPMPPASAHSYCVFHAREPVQSCGHQA